MALSDTAIRVMKPGEKPYKVYDRGGLFVLANPNGQSYSAGAIVSTTRKSS
jgi:hypothetical protein